MNEKCLCDSCGWKGIPECEHKYPSYDCKTHFDIVKNGIEIGSLYSPPPKNILEKVVGKIDVGVNKKKKCEFVVPKEEIKVDKNIEEKKCDDLDKYKVGGWELCEKDNYVIAVNEDIVDEIIEERDESGQTWIVKKLKPGAAS